MRATPFVIMVVLVMVLTFSSGPAYSTEKHSQGAVTGETPHTTGTTGILAPHAPINITSDADFVSQGWPGNGSETDPYMIEGLNITSTEVCISISNVTGRFEIRNCFVSSPVASSNDGIYIDDGGNCSISGCIVQSHFCGFHLNDSLKCTLTGNTARGNSESGFYLYYGGFPTLTNNTATGNSGNGFYLDYCTAFCTLAGNNATGNSEIGFYLNHCGSSPLTNNTATNNGNDGFVLYNHGGNTLTDNTATSNSGNGFYLKKWLYGESTLIHNTATGNSEYGISIGSSSGANTLFLNVIGSNSLSNARNGGGINTWDDGVSRGNYWSDYNGTGVYPIPGTAGSVDRFPFSIEPSIDHPTDIQYEEGSIGHSINWSPSCLHPDRYEVYRNDALIGSSDWDGSDVTVSVDGLTAGTYNYTIMVMDVNGYIALDTVIVTVQASTTATTTTTEPSGLLSIVTIVVVGVEVVIAVIILAIGLRKRRGDRRKVSSQS